MADRLRIFEVFESHIGAGSLEDIEGFLGAEKGVQEFRIDADPDDQVRIYIRLTKFSFQAAKNLFLRLSEFMRRSCYNIYTSEEMQDGVRYLFLTGMTKRDGIKMEIIIEGDTEEAGSLPG